MSDATYQKFVKRLEEVTELPPQTLGPLTGIYKQFARRLKVMPWPWFIGVSFLVAVAFYIVFGSAIATLFTILQRGF